ncbi:MAG: hypothetical protein U5K69_09215 [Balneolaceae bacterium]|nr:hypothetical protein [Balneolaceae bacterium]
MAYWSDRSGEYELIVRAESRQLGEEQKLTSTSSKFKYNLVLVARQQKAGFC